jgi:hypothetical protein
MNAKQLFSIAALLTASGIAMAQAPVTEKPAPGVAQKANAETTGRMDKKSAQPEGKKRSLLRMSIKRTVQKNRFIQAPE